MPKEEPFKQGAMSSWLIYRGCCDRKPSFIWLIRHSKHLHQGGTLHHPPYSVAGILARLGYAVTVACGFLHDVEDM